MKQFVLLLFIGAAGQFPVMSQDAGYELYHRYINKAEELFFVENKPDSSLYYYKMAFAEFDFVFVKDPLNAAQIAFFSQQPFEEFLIKGFEHGLKLSHLESIGLFNPIYDDLVNDKFLQDQYNIGREKYLEKIDFHYLSYVYKKAINDQLDKYKEEYDAIKFANMKEWLTQIREKGFPSAKTIGIDDKNIFREIGHPERDIDSVRAQYGKKLRYYWTEDDLLSSRFIMVILVHNQCAFRELENLFGDLVQKGEIHPREVGLLYDNMFVSGINTKSYSCEIPKTSEGLFYLNQFCPYNQFVSSEKKSDELRAKWFVVPLSVDKAKEEYEEKFGFRVSYGFWNCM